MPDSVFQTARFQVHNPSRHKQAMLMEALRSYHRMAKLVMERALADPEFKANACPLNKRGVAAPNGFATSKFIRNLTPKGWKLAPLRNYMIDDVSAALMSHLAKEHKGKNESNPPTLPPLEPMSDGEFRQALDDLALSLEFTVKPEHQKIIDTERAEGHPRVTHRLERVFRGRSFTKAASQLLLFAISGESQVARPPDCYTECPRGS